MIIKYVGIEAIRAKDIVVSADFVRLRGSKAQLAEFGLRMGGETPNLWAIIAEQPSVDLAIHGSMVHCRRIVEEAELQIMASKGSPLVVGNFVRSLRLQQRQMRACIACRCTC